MRATRLVITAVLSLFLVTTVGFAQAPPSGDSYVASSTPTTNYGPSAILPLQPGVRSYIRFDLSGVPANATVQKAVIRLFVDGFTAPGSFDVYRINAVWDENTLTWSNKPVLGASATGNNPVPITSANSRNFVLVDITGLVQKWVNGTVPNNGIALALTTPAGSFSFDSKENTAVSHEPALEIAIPGATGLQGPQGPQGLTGATGATGPQGPQGPQGQTGATGPQGPIGPIGPQGPAGQDGTNGTNGTNGTGFTFRDGFDNSASYAINDVVTYNGSSYVAIAANQGPNNPTPDMNPAWSLMAQEGAQGQVGATGATGPQGPQGLTGATGATGPQGPQGQTGTTGPQGPIGPIGPQGPAGQDGTNGTNGTNGTGFTFRDGFDNSASYAINDVVTYNGSSYVAIAANQGPNNPTPDMNPAWSLMAQEGAQGQVGATGATGPQGPQGQTGTTGPQGPIGPIGPQGPAGQDGTNGTNGTNGTGFTFRDGFDNSASYAINDVVTYNGSSYVAIAANQGPNNPTPDMNPAWSLMAQEGAQGQAGATGATGPQGPQGLTGATGATGPQGPQGQTGTTGPQGPIGPIGPQGPAGQDGTNGTNGTNGTGFTFRDGFDNSASYAINDVVTYNGSSYVAIAANQGPNNPTPDMNPAWSLMAQEGAQGQVGAAGATGPQGPQGPTGATGPQGPQGLTGATGAQGAQGPQGATGAQGPVGPNYMVGSSGSTKVNASSTNFVGTSGVSTTETDVAQIVPTALSFGHFYCYGPKPTGGQSVTFTVRVGTISGASDTIVSSGTCTVATGAISGTSTISVSLSAGQTIDVQVVAPSSITAGTVSWSVGP